MLPVVLTDAGQRLAAAAAACVAPEGDADAAFERRLATIAAYALVSLVACAALRAASHALSPVLLPRTWAALSTKDREGWHTNVVSAWAALAVPVFAIPAVLAYSGGNLVDTAPSEDSLRGTGLSVGYMLFDFLVLVINFRVQFKLWGGSQYALYVVHHILSFLIWPYAVANARGVKFVNYFLLSEASNVFMVSRYFCKRLGMTESSPVYVTVCVLWLLSFFALRIVPIPTLLDTYVNGNFDTFGPVELYVSSATLPIPSMLNMYWFYQMAMVGVRMLSPKEKKAA